VSVAASRNRIYSGVLLLTLHTWHFPLSYEETSKPMIEDAHRVIGIYNKILKFILGKSDRF
jgi:hypothetical protein